MGSAADQVCLPPKLQTFLTIGQDLDAIKEYLRSTNDFAAGRAAAAVMVYTDIQTVRGLDKPVDYGSGIEFADGEIALLSSNNTGLQIGLWLNGTSGCQDIVAGKLAKNIQSLVHYLETSPASTIFLRIGYEFDNPEFGYSNPLLFRQAFTHIVDACDKRPLCRSKTQFVWHSWGAGGPRLAHSSLSDYYPGDPVVDWIGISVFSQFQHQLGGIKTLKQVLDFAASRDKPVMIAESTIFGGVDKFKDPWNEWFQPVLDLIVQYDIAQCFIFGSIRK